MFTPAELAAEHARAMRIVKAVLAACDARAATARTALAEGFKEGDTPWVLAIGKAAIGMAEGMKDVCGEPHRHLIVTVDGPATGSLANVIRSDHPLPTQRSLDAGKAVKRFVEEAKAAGAPSLTVLMSGGASALICEPIPGAEIESVRSMTAALLSAGRNIQQMNTVRRAADALKGGGLSRIAQPLALSLLVMSDVMGNALHDIGSGPFVQSPTTPDDARSILQAGSGFEGRDEILTALSCCSIPPPTPRPRRVVVVADNSLAVEAASRCLSQEGIDVVSTRSEPALELDGVVQSAAAALDVLGPCEACCWGGEWTSSDPTASGCGGRAQALAYRLARHVLKPSSAVVAVSLATDGVDGKPLAGRAPAAGAAVWGGMWLPDERQVLRAVGLPPLPFETPDEIEDALDWPYVNSYTMFAGRDATRPAEEPPSQLFTGPTGTNVNDLLVVWRVR